MQDVYAETRHVTCPICMFRDVLAKFIPVEGSPRDIMCPECFSFTRRPTEQEDMERERANRRSKEPAPSGS